MHYLVKCVVLNALFVAQSNKNTRFDIWSFSGPVIMMPVIHYYRYDALFLHQNLLESESLGAK